MKKFEVTYVQCVRRYTTEIIEAEDRTAAYEKAFNRLHDEANIKFDPSYSDTCDEEVDAIRELKEQKP